jgi:hypothetical protein
MLLEGPSERSGGPSHVPAARKVLLGARFARGSPGRLDCGSPQGLPPWERRRNREKEVMRRTRTLSLATTGADGPGAILFFTMEVTVCEG